MSAKFPRGGAIDPLASSLINTQFKTTFGNKIVYLWTDFQCLRHNLGLLEYKGSGIKILEYFSWDVADEEDIKKCCSQGMV